RRRSARLSFAGTLQRPRLLAIHALDGLDSGDPDRAHAAVCAGVEGVARQTQSRHVAATEHPGTFFTGTSTRNAGHGSVVSLRLRRGLWRAANDAHAHRAGTVGLGRATEILETAPGRSGTVKPATA